jgi:NTP pyrophosphatase (non-canonical NTP hydrolase)
MAQETQQSINQWALETFGVCKGLDIIADRYFDEVEELRGIVQTRFMAKIEDELADNLIVLFQVASYLNINLLDAVNNKMVINRNRQWKLHGDGTGQHIE